MWDMSLLLTGATGFLGSRLLTILQAKHDIALTLAVRGNVEIPNAHVFKVQEPYEKVDWSSALHNKQIVIHTAARAHVLKNDKLTEHRRVNVEATLNLARQAALANVKRFIFISSMKVHGEQASIDRPFVADDTPRPNDFCGISKWEAEQGLRELAAETDMDVVIIRPPLIYGACVKGNFATLVNWVKKAYPLPLASISTNKRSLIALDNLVDFILLCMDYQKTPQAANQTFVVSDGEDVSTKELFSRVAKAYGKKSSLFPFPVFILHFVAKIVGKGDAVKRLRESLQVDNTKACELLAWEPVVTMDQQLQQMADEDSL